MPMENIASDEVDVDVSLIADLQKICRGHLRRKKFKDDFRKQFFKVVDCDDDRKNRIENTDLLKYGSVVVFFDDYHSIEYLLPLCEKLTTSMQSSAKPCSFAGLLLSIEHMKRATRLVSRLCQILPSLLAQVDLNRITGAKFVTCVVKFFYTYSSCQTWKLVSSNVNVVSILNSLCSKMCTFLLVEEKIIVMFADLLFNGLKGCKTVLSQTVIDMLFTIVLRIFSCCKISDAANSSDVEDKNVRLFCTNFLPCPALIFHLSSSTCNELKSQGLFCRCIPWLIQNQEFMQRLSLTENLNLLANFVHLSYLEHDALVDNLFDWTGVVNFLLDRCQQAVVNRSVVGANARRKNMNNWHHPMLGWISERIDEGTQGTFGRIRLQLFYLWSRQIVECLFGRVLESFDKSSNSNSRAANSMQNDTVSPLPVELMQKLLNKLSLRNQTVEIQNKPLPPVSMTAVVCQLYQNTLITFANMQIEILSGLCRDDTILVRLWNFVNGGDVESSGLNTYISLLYADPTVTLPHFSPLHLFADIAYSLISILDEKEMYESDRPFKVEQLREIARFTNQFCFKVIWEGLINIDECRPHALFQSIYQLCTILHNRDCRRPFTASSSSSSNKQFWIAIESMVKKSQVMAEFERRQGRAQLLMTRMPHVVPLHDRMLLFRKFVQKDKERLSLFKSSMIPATTIITIDRNRIVEDGYRQLANLSSEALRGTIRVKFINQQGLDEAGIDQDGVFKEFLELTLKKVFDPELNLFKITSNRLSYPSSTSSIHEHHLALFQFVGRMLAKAVYEGICVDVQLAPVLLATVLCKQLCPFDELATLDPMLYKNLTYVKHYEDSENVCDLQLTFSYDEEFLGKVKTYELIPGGQDIEVNNENKIMYIHKMAQFRVIKQTKEQCEHFVTGFRSIINPKWLALFSTHELQYLISGHTSDIDFEDLRKHAQYYGGFHSNHRVIKWLWSILENDFTTEERHLFLKFVTSCSRAPLLGFEYLEPPFSIRCVETSDDMDQGDTLGSIVRGFLAIKRKQPITRLPTASTCFNLLKLPNYGKRSVLLEKLRYAIHAETGFELS